MICYGVSFIVCLFNLQCMATRYKKVASNLDQSLTSKHSLGKGVSKGSFYKVAAMPLFRMTSKEIVWNHKISNDVSNSVIELSEEYVTKA